MNKQTIITILFALVSMNMYTQQRLIVRDSLTQEPIAYTSVWFRNEVGGYTDESGMIEIPEGTKQIRLSHISYKTKSIAKVTPDLQTIFLVPKITNLDEVAIREVSITPPIIWFSRKSRIPSMPLSALTSVCQMPRLVPQKTNLSLMVALYFLPDRSLARMVLALSILYRSPRLVYSLWWNG